MGLSLYEISSEYKKVLNDLESMDDLDLQVITDTLEPYKEDLEKKCLAVGAYIKNQLAEAKAIKEAEHALCVRRVAIEYRIDNMKKYLAAHLPGKISDSQTVLSPRAGSKKTIIDDESKLPESCFVTTRKVSLTEVKKVIDDLPHGAAHIETGAPTVTIK